ncbi:hypothetical protein RND81_04G071800 [Saponaria officinalis]|uniref:VQ domain-containing protein n=1 Tax=Saponaria officinalis TaxID=3572 RepID=A0AAW1LIM0_SAPOF
MSCSSTSNEWPYYHYQPPYNNSITIDNFSSHSLSSMDSMTYSKQTKKSKGSKKTPATIFNADVSNFRTLVQQLTGRPSASATIGAQKGPVTISFSQQKIEDQIDVDTSGSTMLPFGCRDYVQQTAPKKQEKKHVTMDQNSNGSCSTIGVVDPSCSVDLLDDFDVHRCLEELDWVVGSTNNNVGHDD